MKKTVFILAFSVLLITLLVLIERTEAQKTEKVRRISFVTAAQTATYYPLAGGMASLINKYTKGIQVTAEPSAGAIENIRLIYAKRAEIGFADPIVLTFLKKEAPELVAVLRQILGGQGNTYHLMVHANSNIHRFSDIRGKRVSIGAPGSGLEKTNTMVFALHGMTFSDVKAEYLSFGETSQAMKDKTIDVATAGAGVPNPTWTELATTTDIRFIPIDLNAIPLRDFPALHPDRIPAKTYRGQPNEVATIGFHAQIYVHKDLDEDMVYQMIKAICEHNGELQKIHVLAKYYVAAPEYIFRGHIVPFHPGAIRYFKEIGLWDKRPKGVEN